MSAAATLAESIVSVLLLDAVLPAVLEFVVVDDAEEVVVLLPEPSRACRSLLTEVAAVCAALVSPDETEFSKLWRSERNWLICDCEPLLEDVVLVEAIELLEDVVLLSLGGGGGGGGLALARFWRSCSTFCAAVCAVVELPDWTALRSVFKSLRKAFEPAPLLELAASDVEPEPLVVLVEDEPESASRSCVSALAADCAPVVLFEETSASSVVRSEKNWLRLEDAAVSEVPVLAAEFVDDVDVLVSLEVAVPFEGGGGGGAPPKSDDRS